jgi:hypothetical protein
MAASISTKTRFKHSKLTAFRIDKSVSQLKQRVKKLEKTKNDEALLVLARVPQVAQTPRITRNWPIK